MATAKKPATKKKATTKKAPAKTTTKSAAARKPVVKKTTTRKKAPKYETLKLSKEKTPFMTYKVTDQTVYWFTLSVVVLILSLWVLHLHLEVASILNSIN